MDRQKAREKAHALVEKMTVEEAASQLRYDAPAIPRLNVKAYNWWNEALHGVARAGTATMYPQAIGMAAAFDEALMQEEGEVIALEGRAKYNAAQKAGDSGIYKGLTFWSPNVNIFRDPRWGRGHETLGEDPFLTGTLGSAYVKGLQGEGEYMKAAACAKHFAVHSGPEKIRHEFNACLSKKELYETYLPAFRMLVDAGVESLMGAYNRTQGEPCCGSKMLMVDILRNDWNFQGHYVSDCWAIQDFYQFHKITSTPEESAALALKMGCDVNCGVTYQYLMSAYRQGMVDEKDIRCSAERLFTTRYLLGIMDEETKWDQVPYSVVCCKEHIDSALKAAQKSCVLLKNNGILPLDAHKIHTLGVIGPNANSRRALIGNYHGTADRYVTVLEGLQDELGEETRILYSEGCHLWKKSCEGLGEEDDRLSEAKAVAENSDAVVLAVGLDETLEGEQGDAGNADASGDKTTLLLPLSQQKLMDQVLSAGKPVVICLMAGSAIDLGDANEKADAILMGWYPGARGGKAIAQILTGKISPSGKLPITFYTEDQLHRMRPFEDYSMDGRTYRYLHEKPLYPFGYGLTYSKTAVTQGSIEKTEKGVQVHVTVENQGERDTEEVVQIYVQNEGSELAPLHPRLCGFKRVFLKAGEKKTVSLFVSEECFFVIDRDGEPLTDGRVVLYAGVGQPDERTKELTGTNCVKILAD